MADGSFGEQQAPSGAQLREALLDAMLHATSDGVVAYDQDLRFVCWNDAMEQFSGLSEREAVGLTLYEAFPFLADTDAERYFRAALAGRVVQLDSCRLESPRTGRRGIFSASFAPMHDAAGQVIGGLSIIRDVTAHEEAEEALRKSEERYRRYVELSSEAIWRVGLDEPVPSNLPEDEQLERFIRLSYLEEVNDAMADMYGAESVESLVGARVTDLLDLNDPRNLDTVRAFIHGGYRVAGAETFEIGLDGRPRAFLNNLTGIEKDGAIVGAWGTQADITERVRVDEALRESEERFRAVFDNAGIGIAVLDREASILLANPALTAMAAYTEDELRRLNLDQLAHPEERYQDAGQRDELIRGERAAYQAERRFLRRDGAILWADLVVTLVRDRKGDPLYLIAMLQDITERVRAREAAEERARIQDAMNLRLSRSMLETHHRVRNNLQMIAALVELQKQDHPDMVPAAELDRICGQVKALAAVHDILTGRAKNGDIDKISVLELLTELAMLLRHSAPARQVTVESEEAHLSLRQGTALAIVANELVTNALKHSDGPVDVRFSVIRGQGALVVTDNGPGFPSDFDPKKATSFGTSLIANVTSWDLGGEIRFESRPGGGKVTAIFPLAAPRHPSSRSLEPSTSR